jgi:hypothetical protein
MTQFERRLRDLMNPVSTGLTRWWCNSAARRAWRQRARGRPPGNTRLPGDLRDLRNSEAVRKAQAALRDVRDGEAGRRAQQAIRDLRDSEAARKAQGTAREFRESEAGRRAEATIQEAEAAARAAYLRIRRSMGGH